MQINAKLKKYYKNQFNTRADLVKWNPHNRQG